MTSLDNSSVSENHSEGFKSVASKAEELEEQQKLEETLAKQETRAVRILRLVVLCVLVTAALLVALAVYLYMRRKEEDDFDEYFFDLANRLVDGFHTNAKLRVQALDSLAITLTATALATQQTWPLVVFDSFEAICTATRVMTSSEYIGVYPVITVETRDDWEQFTMENMEWLNQSFAYQKDFKRTHGRTVGARAPLRRRELMQYYGPTEEDYVDFDTNQRMLEELAVDDDNVSDGPIRNVTWDGTMGISPELWRNANEEDEEGYWYVIEDGPGPYFPMYQVSPAREYTNLDVNYNVYYPYEPGAYGAATEIARATKSAAFAGAWNIDEEGFIWEDDDYDLRSVPVAGLIYPVFDQIEGTLDEKNVVAVIDLDMEFGPLFTSVLPPNSERIVCVVSHPCGQTYSYEVIGSHANYLGINDRHDAHYANMMLSALMADFDDASVGSEYNGVPINKEFCPWTITVYATKEMEDKFITSEPIAYMCAVLGVFLFTCFFFILYDIIVERRQKKVMTTAVNSDKIVSSLFPGQFRDRLYEANEEKEQAQKEQAPQKSRQKTAFRSTSVNEFLEQSNEFMPAMTAKEINSSPPMAELYPNCTVFFADVAGFTSWSSERSPAQVFTLLETLYGAFDKLAKRHKVFKIETIGDCYVAVTGLPRPQPNHAALMVRFARDILSATAKLTKQLEPKLGPGTDSLAMRVGLHSGPVTAGVLRGEKARFQLFGDTVNTAARMESNGVKTCIHVSQETADCLIAIGKEQWLKPREEKIQAKGKGELQTYWVSTTSVAASTTGSQLSTSDECSGLSVSDDDALDVSMIAGMSGEENGDRMTRVIDC